MIEDVLRSWGKAGEKNLWAGSEGTFAVVFKTEFEKLAAACSWRSPGTTASYNQDTHMVEIKTLGGSLLVSVQVIGDSDKPVSATAHVYSLTKREFTFLERLLGFPITFTGNIP